MKRLLVISYYWPPSGGPGVQRAVKFVKYLPENGIEPVVVTVDPARASYPFIDNSLQSDVAKQTRVVRTGSLELLGFFPAVIRAVKLPKPGFAGEGNPGIMSKIMRFIRGNFMVPDARKGWNSYALKASRNLLEKEEFDAILTTSPPHSSQLIGMTLRREFGLPWLADLRDPWTDIYYNRNLFQCKPARMKNARLEKQVLEQADAVITVSESLKALFAGKSTSMNPAKIHVIPNGFDPADMSKLKEVPGEVPVGNNSFIISYTGTLSEINPMKKFAEALSVFQEKHPEADVSVRFTGQIGPEVPQLFDTKGLSGVCSFDGYVEHHVALQRMRESDLLLLIIPDVPHNEGIVTGKLFEYMAAGRPVLGYGPINGDAAKIMQECQVGQMFRYDDAAGTAEWLSALYRQKRAGRSLLAGNEQTARYSRKLHARQLAWLVETVCKEDSSRQAQ